MSEVHVSRILLLPWPIFSGGLQAWHVAGASIHRPFTLLYPLAIHTKC